jgi:hypothetical protein
MLLDVYVPLNLQVGISGHIARMCIGQQYTENEDEQQKYQNWSGRGSLENLPQLS